jgi:flagellin
VTAVGTLSSNNVEDHATAAELVETIDEQIESVSAGRSLLGAYQNRLEHTIANLDNARENLQAAESRIRDLDMAEEIMAFTKNNILQQAATAMLAQANMAPQSVLQLLG